MFCIIYVHKSCFIKQKNERYSGYVLDERQAYDPTGQSSYREACKMLKVIPVSYFLRNMNQRELNMMHYGLGSQVGQLLCILSIPLSNNSVLRA